MWFQTLAERMFAMLCMTVVIVVVLVLAIPHMSRYSTPRSSAPYQGAGGGGGTVPPPDPPPDPDPPPPGSGNKIIWAVGDTCDDQASAISDVQRGCKLIGNMIKADSATNRFLALGDTQYEEGEAANFTNYYNKALGKLQIFSGSSDSIWDRTIAAVGNHEYGTSNATPFFNYFGTVRSGDPTKGYFMTDLGAWRVITLNSNCSEVGGCTSGSAQGVWAAGALDAATAAGEHTMVIYHHPPFSVGANYYPGTTSGLPLWQIAYDHGADIVMTGHDHQFQRWGPLSRTGNPSSGGPQFFVSGAGGKGNSGFCDIDPGANTPCSSGTSAASTLYKWGDKGTLPGALRLVVSDDGTYTFQFKTSDGTVQNSGSGTSR